MAKPTKRKVEGGRVTPKGTGPKGNRAPRGAATESPGAGVASGRYTPPTARAADAPSPLWVPVTMFALLAIGVLMIVLNYIGIVLPGATHSGYLMGGLGFILGGIITATQFR